MTPAYRARLLTTYTPPPMHAVVVGFTLAHDGAVGLRLRVDGGAVREFVIDARLMTVAR